MAMSPGMHGPAPADGRVLGPGALPVVDHPPLAFTAARWLVRRRVRGSTRLFRWLRRGGWLDLHATFDLGGGIAFIAPLNREPEWDAEDIAQYERVVVDGLVRFARRAPRPVTLVDCGADIGLVSLKVAAAARIDHIVAFEPSPTAYPVLAWNLKHLPGTHRALREGVADFVGEGVLCSAAHDPSSDHARFVQPRERGDFPVTTIDRQSIPAGGSVVLKIDVEGGEFEVVRGARTTLGQAAAFAVTLEAHPAAVSRAGVDPLRIVEYLAGIRACETRVLELPDLRLDPSRPFFEQAPPTRVYNLLVTSR
jgi:FkbM family methyltransferase